MSYEILRIVDNGIAEADRLLADHDLSMGARAYKLVSVIQPLYDLFCCSPFFAAYPVSDRLASDMLSVKSNIHRPNTDERDGMATVLFFSIKNNLTDVRDILLSGGFALTPRGTAEEILPSVFASLAIKTSFLPAPFNLTPVGQSKTRLTDSELPPSAFVKKIGDLLGPGLVLGDVPFCRVVITSKVKRGPGKGRFVTWVRNLPLYY